MTIEEMLQYLGVKTQSKESIELCYMMDQEAFNMMGDIYNYYEERQNFENVYKVLLHELGYKKLSDEEYNKLQDEIIYIDLDEEDKEYRDEFFSGLERTLLRFNRYDLISFQPFGEVSVEGKAQDAYLYELNKIYDEALRLYEELGFTDRINIVKSKMDLI